jgi:hypothetical protein
MEICYSGAHQRLVCANDINLVDREYKHKHKHRVLLDASNKGVQK